MAKYKRKVNTINAIKWIGNNFSEVSIFTHGNARLVNKCLFIDGAPINVGDYIISDDDGYIFSPMSADIFEETYELDD